MRPLVARTLRWLGIYDVDPATVGRLDERLEIVERTLHGVEARADAVTRVLQALGARREREAVALALEGLALDSWDGAFGRLDEPDEDGRADDGRLAEEAMRAVRRRIVAERAALVGLVPLVHAAAREAERLLAVLPESSRAWPVARRVGTPDALRTARARAAVAGSGVRRAAERLDALRRSLDALQAGQRAVAWT